MLLSADHQFTPPQFNIIYRVVMLKDTGKPQGSGFLVDVSGFQYLVTALHLINVQSCDTEIMWKNEFCKFPCKILGTCENSDLAVLKPEQNLVPQGLPVEMSMGGILYGQHTFFLGFPSGDKGSFSIVDDGDRPIPFVKWAGVSMVTMTSPKEVILDGHNNLGFSGGPVCFTNSEKEQKILGMIRGFREEISHVEHFSDEEYKPELVYKQNSGLISVTSATEILDLVNSCETGLPI